MKSPKRRNGAKGMAIAWKGSLRKIVQVRLTRDPKSQTTTYVYESFPIHKKNNKGPAKS